MSYADYLRDLALEFESGLDFLPIQKQDHITELRRMAEDIEYDESDSTETSGPIHKQIDLMHDEKEMVRIKDILLWVAGNSWIDAKEYPPKKQGEYLVLLEDGTPCKADWVMRYNVAKWLTDKKVISYTTVTEIPLIKGPQSDLRGGW